MKAQIHPKYYEAKVTCACGNAFTTGSILPEIRVEICSACHPFFTGEMRFVDTQGRVEKFQQKMRATAGKKFLSKKQRRAKEKAKQATSGKPVTLKEMLSQHQKKTAKTTGSSRETTKEPKQ